MNQSTNDRECQIQPESLKCSSLQSSRHWLEEEASELAAVKAVQ